MSQTKLTIKQEMEQQLPLYLQELFMSKDSRKSKQEWIQLTSRRESTKQFNSSLMNSKPDQPRLEENKPSQM